MEYKHTPVMIQEIIDHLAIKRGGYYIDCTLGSGGYTEEISKTTGGKGRVFSFDLDENAIINTEKKKLKNVTLINDNFRNIKKNINETVGEDVRFDGIVFDLGLSSYQLEDRSRGFSFKSSESLNMAFGANSLKTTEYIVNHYKENDLARIIFQYGEERDANRIARAIVRERKNGEIKDPGKLAQIIISSSRSKSKKIHPATKTFQALRIETNDELSSLREALPAALSLLKPGGRLVVVSFHSLEDRIVKNFFKIESTDCLCPSVLPICTCGHKKSLKVLTKKPIEASIEEIKNNPRSRSAKLRSAERL